MARKRPVPLRVANCASVSTGPRRAANVFQAAITRPGSFGFPRIVLACEAADFDAVLEAEMLGWEAVQIKESTATAGSAIAWDPDYARAVGKPSLLPGTPAGEGIRARSFLRQRLELEGHDAEPFLAGHAPPDRADEGQEAYLNKARDYRGVIGLDSNRWPGEIEAMDYRRHYVGVGVLGVFVPRGIPVSEAKRIDLIPGQTFDDHPGADVLLWNDLLQSRLITERNH